MKSIKVIAICATVAALGMFSHPAAARPDCNSCIPAYQECLESGEADCDSRYAVCLRFCPYPFARELGLDASLVERKDRATPVRQRTELTRELSAFKSS